MLFMTIFNYKPGERNLVITRRAEKGPLADGIKIIGEWSSIAGGRVFRLVETDDIKALQMAIFAWSDLGTIDAFPVMEVEEIMKMMSGKK